MKPQVHNYIKQINAYEKIEQRDYQSNFILKNKYQYKIKKESSKCLVLGSKS